MPLFVMNGADKPDSLELRKATRSAHLQWIETLGDRVKLAGPVLNDGGAPSGSLIIIEAADLQDAEATFSQDPYTHAGLWADITIRPFTQVKP